MKRVIKHFRNNLKLLIGIIVSGIIFGSLGVYAATVIAASNVGYSDNASLGATNVQDAIDKLNTKATIKIKEAEAKCPKGYKCTEIPKLCKRATKLHTEICSNEDNSGYCQADGYALNDTITYGNLGTTGTLTSGDAFDCDVNGDGVYDAKAERFYYVSDYYNTSTKSFKNDTAVLIYYNNVSRGVASNSTTYAYASSRETKNGPVTALAQLPTTNQWKNVSLINATRDITDEKNIVRKSAFSYEGYAARLLTVQEVSAGCGVTVGSNTKGELSSKCKYLMENTKYSSSSIKTYGGWLESPDASYANYNAWYVLANVRLVNSYSVGGDVFDGVRPAIEVLKSNISY